VLAEEVAVVTQEQDAGAVELPGALEDVEQHPHPLVHRGHHGRAQADLLLGPRVDRGQYRLGPLRRLEPEGLRPGRLRPHDLLGRQHVGPRREHAAPVEVPVALGRLVTTAPGEIEGAVGGLVGIRVHRLVGEEEAPRLRARALDERHRLRVQQVGDVAGRGAPRPVDVQLRIEELAVAVEAHPAVVAGTGRAVVAHVPLAHVRGLVTEPLQLHVIVRQAVARRVARHVVDDAVAARVLAGHDRRAVGRAERRGVERVEAPRALAGEPVHVGRQHVRMPARPELVEAQVVDQDDEQVGAPGRATHHGSLARPGRRPRVGW
jgi:hypothetical protein